MDELVVFRLVVLARDLGTEADGSIVLLQALLDDLVDADEGTADDEEDVRRVHLDGRRLGVLALAARGELDHGALQHLQQGLLHALVARVGRDGVVRAGLAGNLVELVEVDDAVFGLLDVLVGRVVEVAHGHLYIRADEAGLGEAGGVRHGEGDVEQFREVREQGRLAAAGGAEHDDVRFLDLRTILILIAVLHAFVVVVHGHGEHFFCAVLVDDVLVEVLLDDMWLVLLENLVELRREILMIRLRCLCIVLVKEMVDFADAILADGETRLRIVDRHIVLVMYLHDALAEAALHLGTMVIARHKNRPFFLSRDYDSPNLYYLISSPFFQANFVCVPCIAFFLVI